MGFIEDPRFRRFKARCVYFDRYGGVSAPPFDELNASLEVGDKAINVEKNLHVVESLIGAEKLASVNQVHSENIVEFDGETHDADGIYTTQRGVFLSIKFADCLPIVMLETEKMIAMAIHAGWKGTHKRIAQKGVKLLEKLGGDPSRILVSIGPHICGRCYQVGPEFYSLFSGRYLNERNGKLFLDLSLANTDQLIDAGIARANIVDLHRCTMEDIRFFSYRRDRVCGRNIGGIMLL